MNQGTIPFLSVALLQQISEALQQKYSKKRPVYQEDCATSIQIYDEEDDLMVRHKPVDDMESLFYVLVWNMVLYDSPLGQEWQDFNFESSILRQWSECVIQNLESARNSKVTFIVDPDPGVLLKHVSQYCSNLVLLAEQWQGIFRERFITQEKVDFDSLLQVTDKFLKTVLLEDPPEITNQCLTMQAEKESLYLPLVADSTLNNGRK